MLHGPQACSMVYAEFFWGATIKIFCRTSAFFNRINTFPMQTCTKIGGGKKGIFSLFAFFIILYLQRRLTAIERAAIYQ